jgi:hypothetical protein
MGAETAYGWQKLPTDAITSNVAETNQMISKTAQVCRNCPMLQNRPKCARTTKNFINLKWVQKLPMAAKTAQGVQKLPTSSKSSNGYRNCSPLQKLPKV